MPEKVASKLEQGLDFTVKVDLWFCNDDFCKNPEGKKRDFCRFTMTLKTVNFVHVQGGILQKAPTLHFFRCLNLKDILLDVHN